MYHPASRIERLLRTLHQERAGLGVRAEGDVALKAVLNAASQTPDTLRRLESGRLLHADQAGMLAKASVGIFDNRPVVVELRDDMWELKRTIEWDSSPNE